jgi:outer membrane receptor protein involved in Fe transport
MLMRYAALLLSVFLTAPAYAQEITGTITGAVTDQSGAAIPGLTVTVRNMGTNATQSVVTDENGVYVATLLPAGRYEVSLELAGFKRFVRSNLEVSVNDRLGVNIMLQPGDVSETVTVTAATPLVKTESSDVSTLISAKQVEQMPLNGRNIMSLVAMQPGVSSTLPSTLGVGFSNLTNVFVNGNRASQNNWMVDGADNNDAGSNLALINYVNVDTVQEVNILRSNYSAEFGRNAGGQVNVVTKSGSNAFHGSLFEFMRDDKFDASPFFGTLDLDRDGKRDPNPVDYHNFGGTIGGPLLRDKVFFFFGEEFRKIETMRGTGINITRTPTDAQRNGNFAGLPTIIDPLTGQPFPGNVIPADRIDPIARSLASVFPAPNGDFGGGRNFSAETLSQRDFRQEFVRVDYRHSDAHNFYARFINDSIPTEEPFGEVFNTNFAAFPGIAATETNNPGRSLVGNWTWVLSSGMLNEVAYNYSRGAIESELVGNGLRPANAPKIFTGQPGDPWMPSLVFNTGGYGNIDFFGPYDNNFGSHRFKDTFTWLRGSHALKFGTLLSWEFKNENNAQDTNGAFTFPGASSAAFTSTGDAFADFLLGRALTYAEPNVDITSHLRYQMYEFFAQDDWTVTPNLTLNLGLRYSLILQPTDTENVLTNFDPEAFDPSRAYQIDSSNNRVPGTGDPLNGIVIAGVNSPYGDRITQTDKTNFGPRAGFAWDVTGDGMTAVRGGYGLYYDRTLVGIALQNAFVNPPFVVNAVFNASGNSVPTLSTPAGGAQRNNEALVVGLIAMEPEFKTPRVHQFSLGVQRQLPGNFVADVAYVGAQGRHLLRTIDINRTNAGAPANFNSVRPYRGYGNIQFRETTATSSYNSLQTSVSRRFQDGLLLTLNYTLSRAVSDSSSDRNAADFPQYQGDLESERAVTAYDRTHIFGAHYVWELPFFTNRDNRLLYNTLGGWQISGSTKIATGIPLTVTTQVNTANSFGQGATLRPDLTGDPDDAPGTVEQFFNTGAFTQPSANRFGNAPRSVFRLPYQNATDLGVFKNFDIGGRVGLQFRAEMFNVFNRTNFTNANTIMGNPAFGRLTTAAEPRLIQFGLRATF